jgi:hypothetical protein
MRIELPIDEAAAREAITEATASFPSMAAYAANARLRCLPLPGGGSTFILGYEPRLPPGLPDAWEFQNAVVRAYKRRTGGQPGGACDR